MHVRHRRLQQLQEREPEPEPALITVPWVIPSIPLLSPLLDPIITPFIVGQPRTTSTSSTRTISSTTPTQAPAPPPTSGVNTSPPSAPSPSSESDPESGSGGNSNNSPSSVATATSPPSPAQSGSTGSASNGSSGNSPSENGSNSGKDGASPSSLDVVISAKGPGQAFVTHSDSSSDAEETQAAGNGSGQDKGTGNGAQFTGRLTETTTGAFPGSTAVTRGNDPLNPTGPTDTVEASAARSGVSSGIIIAICVIAGLLGLILILCCVRRRAIMARLRRRKQWYAGAGAERNEKDYSDQDPFAAGSRSARSSFATTFDRGQMLVTPIPQFDIHVEQMTQVWPSDLSGSNIAVPPASHAVPSAASPTIRSPDRTSVHSQSSDGSHRASQVSLTVPPLAATEGSPYGMDPSSPFSVRPFSPSETFSFPKPPQDDAQSRVASEILSASVKSSRRGSAFYTAEESRPTPTDEAENPFADFTEIVRPPSTSTDNSVPQHFAPVEMIQRPFVPSMDDEMAVKPGDEVRILKRFDDGWAVAEKLGKNEQGLIPIDCMRPVEEELPAFLAKKRISSYRARSSMMTRASVVSGGSSTVGAAM